MLILLIKHAVKKPLRTLLYTLQIMICAFKIHILHDLISNSTFFIVLAPHVISCGNVMQALFKGFLQLTLYKQTRKMTDFANSSLILQIVAGVLFVTPPKVKFVI